jgi:lipopolysaccharide transport system permease protein
MIDRLKDLWLHRELLWNMTVKELKVKYKRSVLGFLWSFMNPLIMLAVFSLVFTILVKNDDMQWFVVYLMSGLLTWLFFVNSLMQSVGSVVGNAGLVKKVYFPREILPLAAVGANIFHFIMQMLVFFVFLLILQWHFSIYILFFPLVMLLEIVFTLGLCLFLSAANVYLRDVQHFVEVATMAWFWLTPIVYLIGMVMDKLGRWFGIYLLNPVTNIVELWQFIIYNPHYYAAKTYLPGHTQANYVSFWAVFYTCVLSVMLLVLGYWYFVRKDRGFAEQI